MYKNKKPVIGEKITEFKEKMSEVLDEPRGREVKDQHRIDMVKLNTFIRTENVTSCPHGVDVVRSPIVAN